MPLIVYRPGKIKPGTSSTEVLHIIDIYPTLAELARAELPDKNIHPLDGESFVPILLGQKHHLNRDAIYGHFPGYMDSRSVPTTFIIKDIGKDRYKMLYFYEPQAYELYKISEDLGESKNLLKGQVSLEVLSIAKNLRKDILSWLDKMNPEPMTFRSSGKLVPLPVPLNEN